MTLAIRNAILLRHAGSRALHALGSTLQQLTGSATASGTYTSSSSSSSTSSSTSSSSSSNCASTTLLVSSNCWPQPCSHRAYSSTNVSPSEQQGSTPAAAEATATEAAAATADPAVAAAKELTRAIRKATGPGQLLQLVQQHRADLSPSHVSAVFHHAARMCEEDGSGLRDPDMQQLLQQLPALAEGLQQQQQYGATELASIMCSSTHLQLPGVVAALLPALLQQEVLQDADAWSIATVLSILDKSGMSLPADQVQQLFAVMLSQPDTRSQQHAKGFLAAQSLLKQQLSSDPEQLQQLLQRLHQMMQALPATAAKKLKQTIMAASNPKQLLQLMQQHRAELKPLHVSAVFTRAARMCEQNRRRLQDPDMQQVRQQLPALAEGVQQQQQCGAMQLGDIIWACAHLQLPDVLAALLPAYVQQDMLQSADTSRIAKVLWSVDKSGTSPAADQVQQLFAALLSKQNASSEHIATGLLAAVRLLKQPLSSGSANADAIAYLLHVCANRNLQLPSEELGLLIARFAESLPDASAHSTHRLLWAVYCLKKHAVQAHLHHLQHVVDHMLSLLPEASTAAIRQTLFVAAYWRLHVSQQQVGLVMDVLTSEPGLSHSGSMVVSSVLRSVAILGHQVSGQQLDVLMRRLVEVLPDAKPQHIRGALEAAAAMGHRIPADIQQPLVARLGRSEVSCWRPDVAAGSSARRLSHAITALRD